MLPPTSTKPVVNNNGYDNGGGDAFDVFTSDETGAAINVVKALRDAEASRFASTISGFVQELYSQGGNKAIEAWAPFIEGAARSESAVVRSLQQGANAWTKLDNFKLIKNIKAGPILDVAIGSASVYNDYRNGDNWVSEAFKQAGSIGIGIGAAAATTAGIAALGLTAPAWGTALAAGLVAAGATYAFQKTWDTVEENWDEIVDWTSDKVTAARDTLVEAKDASLAYLEEKKAEFGDWVNEQSEAFSQWADTKERQIRDLAEYATEKGAEFGQEIVDFWNDAKDKAADAAQVAKDFLVEQGQKLVDYGKEVYDKTADYVAEQYDRISDNIEDYKTAVTDWGKETLKDLSDEINDLKSKASDLFDDFKRWWNDEDEDTPEHTDDARDRSTTARTEASPLVLDLDGDGIELTDLAGAGAVYWDIDVDGFKERSGWVGADDGLLAIDANGNGIIDDHSELFGTLEVDGFSILSVLDTNSDGVIDASDDTFGELLVWRDLDQNGISDAGELADLATMEIASINLSASLVTEQIAGNTVTHTSTYTTDAGQVRTIVDAWFAYDNVNTRYGGDVPFDSLALALPQVRGYGTIADLHTAMALDVTLRDMVLEIANEPAELVFDPDFDLTGKMEAMLYRWAGVEDVDPAGRGSYIDGRALAFVEAFTDRAFLQSGRPNPAPEASRTLQSAFDTIFNQTMLTILTQSVGDALFTDRPGYLWESDTFVGDFTLDFTKLETLAELYESYVTDAQAAWVNIVRLIDTAIGVETLGAADRVELDRIAQENGGVSVEAALASIYPPVGLGLNGTSGDDNLRGGGGRDNLSTGDGDDKLFGMRGDDYLQAGNGDDRLEGGDGNDTAIGGAGNDRYIWTGGFDTLIDSEGRDKLVIEGGVLPSDTAYLISPFNPDDLEIYAFGQLIIRIEGFFDGPGKIEKIQFENGQIFNLVEIAAGVKGTSGDDVIDGDQNPFFSNDRILGLKGDDTLRGGEGADVLSGGKGDDLLEGGVGGDILLGGTGVDVLKGGEGPDRMLGGTGNDIYYLQGNDEIIEEGGSNDTVVLAEGIGFGDITLSRVAYSNDLQIDTGQELVKILDFFRNADSQIEKIAIVKSDGSLARRKITDFTIEQHGTDAYDYIRGDVTGGSLDDIIRAFAGADRIYGYEGRDLLDGGLGDDSLYGGIGGDMYRVGFGHDFVQDYSAIGDADDMVEVVGVTKAEAEVTRALNGALKVDWGSGSVMIDRAFHERYAVEKVMFEDGARLRIADLSVTTMGTDGNDYVYGNREMFGSHDDDLKGMGGDDRLYGYDGDDKMTGGAGDDQMEGAEGADLYITGEGHDYINDYGADGDGDDQVRFAGVDFDKAAFSRLLDGDLFIQWADGSLRINQAFDARYAVEQLLFTGGHTVRIDTLQVTTTGTLGNDNISGNREEFGSHDDILVGLDGNDYLYGYDGDDVLDGGLGDDTLSGAGGQDTYLVGYGDDIINEYADEGDGPDTVDIQGQSKSDVTLYRLGDGDLLGLWDGGSVRIDRAFDERYAVERMTFSGAQTLDLTTLKVATLGTNLGETLSGNTEEFGSRDDTLLGLKGNDTLNGYDGKDMLDGGEGDDTLRGGVGVDTYLVGLGDDYISDYGDIGDGNDRIDVQGIARGDVTFQRMLNGDLLASWLGGSVQIYRAFDERYAIERMFFDGTSRLNVTAMQVETIGSNTHDTIYGNTEEYGSRDDILIGRQGNDTLHGYDGEDVLDGGEGDDTYYGADGADEYRVGQGDDYINDTGKTEDGVDIVNVIGVAKSDVSFSRMLDGDILAEWTGGSVRINNGFDLGYAVERMLFDGGQGTNLTTKKLTTYGTNGGERLNGNQEELGSRDDRLVGRDGDDTFYGYDGDDTIETGRGNDVAYGAGGADTYILRYGNDYISDYSDIGDGRDLVILKSVARADVSMWRTSDGDLHFGWADGSLRIKDGFDARYAVEDMQFDGGSTLDLTMLALTTHGTDGNETVYGNTEEFGSRDDKLLGKDGDDTLYGYDGDDILDGGDGDDAAYGAGGADTYVIRGGDDFLSDYSDVGDGDDVVDIRGVQRADVSFYRRNDGDVVASWDGGSVRMDQALDERYHIESVTFNGAEAIDLDVLSMDTLGSNGNETLYGNTELFGLRDDRLMGRGGDDTLYGYDGNDLLDGGSGDDNMYGGAGDDSYQMSAGADYIDEQNNGGADVVLAMAGLVAGDFTYEQLDTYDLRIRWGTTDELVINNQFSSANYVVEILRLDDGTEIDLTAVSTTIATTPPNTTFYGDADPNTLTGNAGNNAIYGYAGNDILDGLEGDDSLSGAAGADTYLVGLGADRITDNGTPADGIDSVNIQGKSRADVDIVRWSNGSIFASWDVGSVEIVNGFDINYAVEQMQFSGAETLDLTTFMVTTVGTASGETIYGNREELGSEDDTILGLEGDDTLYSYAGDDILEGGAGDDSSYGADGADLYIVGEDDDFVQDYGAVDDENDRVNIAGVQAADVAMWRLLDGDLFAEWDGGSVRIDRVFDQRYAIEEMTFSGAELLDVTMLALKTLGTGGDDTIYGNTEEYGSRDDDLRGLGGDDTIYGYDGDDILNGGDGNDSLYGAAGADMYKVGSGDDFIRDYSDAGEVSVDTVNILGVSRADVSLRRLGDGDVLAQWADGSVRIDQAFDGRYAIEQMLFSGGEALDFADLKLVTYGTGGSETIYGNRATLGSRNDDLRGLDGDDRLYAYDGNDILDGGEGDDELYGAEGADIYNVGLGDDFVQDYGLSDGSDGLDRINIEGISRADASFARMSNGDMLVSWDGGSVLIDNVFDIRYGIERMRFSNAEQINLTTMAVATYGTGGSETIYGNTQERGSRDDTIFGLDGDDTIYAYDGDDVMEGGLGNDSYYGTSGSDTYRVGLGHDYVQDYYSAANTDVDVVEIVGVARADAEITRQTDRSVLVEWNGGSVRLYDAFSVNYSIETLLFDGGEAFDLTTARLATYGTDGGETIYGNTQANGSRNDRLYGLEGDDSLYGYDGDDVFDGGLGDDAMYGAQGADLYRLGQGHDYISDAGDLEDGDDVLRLNNVNQSDADIYRMNNGTLVIGFDEGSVSIQYGFDIRYAVETVIFKDATLDVASYQVETRGTRANDSLSGNREELGSRDDIIFGLEGNDTLYGYDGDDTLDGGLGDDTSYGGAGNDRYVLSEGMDRINEQNAGTLDTLVLADGMVFEDLEFERVNNSDLAIRWDGNETIIQSHFSYANYRVELLELADGTLMDLDFI